AESHRQYIVNASPRAAAHGALHVAVNGEVLQYFILVQAPFPDVAAQVECAKWADAVLVAIHICRLMVTAFARIAFVSIEFVAPRILAPIIALGGPLPLDLGGKRDLQVDLCAQPARKGHSVKPADVLPRALVAFELAGGRGRVGLSPRPGKFG